MTNCNYSFIHAIINKWSIYAVRIHFNLVIESIQRKGASHRYANEKITETVFIECCSHNDFAFNLYAKMQLKRVPELTSFEER